MKNIIQSSLFSLLVSAVCLQASPILDEEQSSHSSRSSQTPPATNMDADSANEHKVPVGHFSSLPVEMIQRILYECPEDDMNSISLVSKDLYYSTQDPFFLRQYTFQSLKELGLTEKQCKHAQKIEFDSIDTYVNKVIDRVLEINPEYLTAVKNPFKRLAIASRKLHIINNLTASDIVKEVINVFNKLPRDKVQELNALLSKIIVGAVGFFGEVDDSTRVIRPIIRSIAEMPANEILSRTDAIVQHTPKLFEEGDIEIFRGQIIQALTEFPVNEIVSKLNAITEHLPYGFADPEMDDDFYYNWPQVDIIARFVKLPADEVGPRANAIKKSIVPIIIDLNKQDNISPEQSMTLILLSAELSDEDITARGDAIRNNMVPLIKNLLPVTRKLDLPNFVGSLKSFIKMPSDVLEIRAKAIAAIVTRLLTDKLTPHDSCWDMYHYFKSLDVAQDYYGDATSLGSPWLCCDLLGSPWLCCDLMYETLMDIPTDKLQAIAAITTQLLTNEMTPHQSWETFVNVLKMPTDKLQAIAGNLAQLITEDMAGWKRFEIMRVLTQMPNEKIKAIATSATDLFSYSMVSLFSGDINYLYRTCFIQALAEAPAEEIGLRAKAIAENLPQLYKYKCDIDNYILSEIFELLAQQRADDIAWVVDEIDAKLPHFLGKNLSQDDRIGAFGGLLHSLKSSRNARNLPPSEASSQHMAKKRLRMM